MTHRPDASGLRDRTQIIIILGVLLGGLAFSAWFMNRDSVGGDGVIAADTSVPPTSTAPTATSVPGTTTSAPPATEQSTTSSTLPSRPLDTVPGYTVGQAWGETVGLTMFRGNPTRTYHGTGQVSAQPSVTWRYPDEAMCASSSDGGVTSIWCGTGWTGQPVVWERPDGVTEVIFGAYDRAVHFVDAETGQALRPSLPTGDIIKGSVTLDPDGYPLLYFGSRDNMLRIVALDRDEPTVLWSMDANEVSGIWNNDWDSNPVIVDDIMYEGGENGWFFAIGLNRGYDADGLVTVDPERLFEMPGYDNELLVNSGRNVSIESSVALYDQRVYFTNSGGRIVGLDISDIRSGNAPLVFDYYAGGDIDATMAIDAEGMLYVSIEHEPSEMGVFERERNVEVGQLVKLDPYASGDPLVWGVDLRNPNGGDSGSWSSPALHDGMVYLNTHVGELIAVDGATGTPTWSSDVGFHSWSSPAVVGDVLVVATCLGELRGYSLANPRRPERIWTVEVSPSCLESTPAIWGDQIFIGARDGFVRALQSG